MIVGFYSWTSIFWIFGSFIHIANALSEYVVFFARFSSRIKERFERRQMTTLTEMIDLSYIHDASHGMHDFRDLLVGCNFNRDHMQFQVGSWRSHDLKTGQTWLRVPHRKELYVIRVSRKTLGTLSWDRGSPCTRVKKRIVGVVSLVVSNFARYSVSWFRGCCPSLEILNRKYHSSLVTISNSTTSWWRISSLS